MTSDRQNRPFVHVNFAIDADGAMRSAPISCVTDWRRVHGLRERHTAVAVGAVTFATDTPRLTVRPERLGRMPARQPDVVLFAGSRVLDGASPGRRVFHVGQHTAAGTIHVPACAYDLGGPLGVLRARGIASLLVEGGRTLLRSFIDQGAVDKLTAFVRTKDAPVAVEALATALPGCPPLLGLERLGEGMLLTCGPRRVHARAGKRGMEPNLFACGGS